MRKILDVCDRYGTPSSTLKAVRIEVQIAGEGKPTVYEYVLSERARTMLRRRITSVISPEAAEEIAGDQMVKDLEACDSDD